MLVEIQSLDVCQMFNVSLKTLNLPNIVSPIVFLYLVIKFLTESLV